jgi:two-component system chemotaxis response regulator CheB
VVLSGGGYDGKVGLLAIKSAGGLALVQRPQDSAAPSMPRHAIIADRVDAILSIEDLATAIDGLMRTGTAAGVPR